jgi:hypothetical protein
MDLELAFTMNMLESTPYLDLRTGKVELGGDPDVVGEGGLSEEEIEAEFAEGNLIHIEPIESSVEYDWMVEFAESVVDRRLREKLEVALDGRGAFRRFKNVLADYPAERDRWFAFHDARVREAIEEWLENTTLSPQRTLLKETKRRKPSQACAMCYPPSSILYSL